MIKHLNVIRYTCVSESLSRFDKSVLSLPTRYWFFWNSSSSSFSWSGENVVRARLGRSRSSALGNTSSFTLPLASETGTQQIYLGSVRVKNRRVWILEELKDIQTIRESFFTEIKQIKHKQFNADSHDLKYVKQIIKLHKEMIALGWSNHISQNMVWHQLYLMMTSISFLLCCFIPYSCKTFCDAHLEFGFININCLD